MPTLTRPATCNRRARRRVALVLRVARGCAVAAGMRRPAVADPIVVVVEIPRFARLDGLAAARARRLAQRHDRLEPLPRPPMRGVLVPLRSLRPMSSPRVVLAAKSGVPSARSERLAAQRARARPEVRARCRRVLVAACVAAFLAVRRRRVAPSAALAGLHGAALSASGGETKTAWVGGRRPWIRHPPVGGAERRCVKPTASRRVVVRDGTSWDEQARPPAASVHPQPRAVAAAR